MPAQQYRGYLTDSSCIVVLAFAYFSCCNLLSNAVSSMQEGMLHVG